MIRIVLRSRLTGLSASVLAALLLAGCSELSGPSRSGMHTFGGGLLLSVFESQASLAPDSAGRWSGQVRDPRIVLSLRIHPDANPYHCGGLLLTDFAVDGSSITAHVTAVDPWQGACMGWPRPPFSSTFLELEEGEYTLDVSVLAFAYRYRLSITDAALELEPVSPRLPVGAIVRPAIEADFLTFWRFPERTFAFYCFDQRQGACEVLAEQMRLQLGLDPITFPEAGRSPFPVPGGPAGSLVRYFRHASEEFPRENLCTLFLEHDLMHTATSTWRAEALHGEQCGEAA